MRVENRASKLCHSLDDFEPAKIRSMAHGRPPIAAPDGNMKQLRIRFEHVNRHFPVIGSNRFFKLFEKRV